MNLRFRRPSATLLVACLIGAPWIAGRAAAAHAAALTLEEVVASVTQEYPPLLAAMIERDIASGRLQSARGAFDLNLFTKLYGNPAGYYQYGTVDVGVEQFTGLWGSTILGGYRLTRGDVLPDYYWNRTQGAGEPRLGVNLPLLRDGAIDRRRAAAMKAQIDRQLADPAIARQRLDFLRAGTVAYVSWLAAGQRWELAESLLRTANERTDTLTRQAQAGLVAPIVLTDNRRLVVAREIGIVQARRRFEAAALALSLFYRSADGEPIVASRARLPETFPEVEDVDPHQLEANVNAALARRPELIRLQLALDKLEVDRKLARNQMQPNLDAAVTISQDFGEDIYVDKSAFEVQAGVELKFPVQRSEARGRLAEVEGQIGQIVNEQRFARDRIRAEVQDSFSAVVAAHEQIRQTRLNADLALELQSAEEERFRRGAIDLLALQLREQAAFDAQALSVDALAEYFRALADYRAATASAL
jgi:outer membrane protein TolC